MKCTIESRQKQFNVSCIAIRQTRARSRVKRWFLHVHRAYDSNKKQGLSGFELGVTRCDFTAFQLSAHVALDRLIGTMWHFTKFERL